MTDIAAIGHNGGPPIETWAPALAKLDDEQLLGRAQLAKILGISTRTLTRITFAGMFPSIKFGKNRLYRVGSVKESLRKRERPFNQRRGG